MGRFWRAVGLVALLATQACWLQAGGGPQRQGYTGLETAVTAANVADLTEVWTTTAGGAPREALVDGARAYIRTPGGLQALDARTGARVWTTAGAATIGGDRVPAKIGDRLYLPDTSGACWLTQIDAGTGAILDRQRISPEPVIDDGAFSACLAGDALAVGSTVLVRWSYILLASFPMCSDGGIISRNHWAVTAFDVHGGPDGWNVDVVDTEPLCGLRNERLNNEVSSGAPGSAVFTEGGNVSQVACTGEGCPGGWSVSTRHSTGTNAWAPVVLPNGDVAVHYGQLLVIDGASHTVEWTGEARLPVGSRPLAADRESIFATTADGRVVAFPVDGCGAATCIPSWSATLPSPASARPSIGGDVLYVGSEDGTVSAFAAAGCGAATCSALWTATTPAEITGAPVIAGGRVIVGSSDGTITAFALPDADG